MSRTEGFLRLQHVGSGGPYTYRNIIVGSFQKRPCWGGLRRRASAITPCHDAPPTWVPLQRTWQCSWPVRVRFRIVGWPFSPFHCWLPAGNRGGASCRLPCTTMQGELGARALCWRMHGFAHGIGLWGASHSTVPSRKTVGPATTEIGSFERTCLKICCSPTARARPTWRGCHHAHQPAVVRTPAGSLGCA